MIPFSVSDVQHRSLPIVNILLIGLSTLVFLYELTLGGVGLLWGGGGLDISAFFSKWGFIPDELTQGQACTHRMLEPPTFPPSDLGDSCTALTESLRDIVLPNLPLIPLTDGRALLNIDSPVPTWATIFSSMFIHGGLFHFAGNMMFLWVFGDNIEDRLGHLKYLGFYLLTGVVATLSHLAVDPHSQAPLVGASGAIAGVMGAYLLLYPYNRIRALVIFFFITVIEIQALIFLGIWFFLQILNSIGALGLAAGVNVAFMAHVGGFLCGAVIIGVYKLLTGQTLWPSRNRRQPWDYWYRTRRGPD